MIYYCISTFSYVHTTDSCPHNGNIHLVGPSGPNTVEGRVEYCSNGLWGTISNSGFDTRDGEVVCRQLGHQNPRELDITTCVIVTHNCTFNKHYCLVYLLSYLHV